MPHACHRQHQSTAPEHCEPVAGVGKTLAATVRRCGRWRLAARRAEAPHSIGHSLRRRRCSFASCGRPSYWNELRPPASVAALAAMKSIWCPKGSKHQRWSCGSRLGQIYPVNRQAYPRNITGQIVACAEGYRIWSGTRDRCVTMLLRAPTPLERGCGAAWHGTDICHRSRRGAGCRDVSVGAGANGSVAGACAAQAAGAPALPFTGQFRFLLHARCRPNRRQSLPCGYTEQRQSLGPSITKRHPLPWCCDSVLHTVTTLSIANGRSYTVRPAARSGCNCPHTACRCSGQYVGLVRHV